MSTATVPRFRRPKLTVFGVEPPPRHETAWIVSGVTHLAVRFWTESEWASVPEYARPDDTAWLPGVGWFRVDVVTKDEHKRIRARMCEDQENAAFIRGMGD